MTTAVVVVQAVCSQAEKAWFTVPQLGRFFVSGCLGNGLLYVMDSGLYQHVLRKVPDHNLPKLVRGQQESLSFFVAYFFQIVVQHFLHAVLVFGRHTINTWDKYQYSLVECYKAFFGILCASTVCNALLLRAGVPKFIAFWGTLYVFGCVSYLILSMIAKMTPQAKETTTPVVPRGGGAFLLPSRMRMGQGYYNNNNNNYYYAAVLKHWAAIISPTTTCTVDDSLFLEQRQRQLLNIVTSTGSAISTVSFF